MTLISLFRGLFSIYARASPLARREYITHVFFSLAIKPCPAVDEVRFWMNWHPRRIQRDFIVSWAAMSSALYKNRALMNWPTQSIQWDTSMFAEVGWAQQSRTDEDYDATELQYRTNDAVIKLTVTWPCSGYSTLGVVRIKNGLSGWGRHAH